MVFNFGEEQDLFLFIHYMPINVTNVVITVLYLYTCDSYNI